MAWPCVRTNAVGSGPATVLGMSVAAWSLVLGAFGLLVSLTVLWLAWRTDRRTSERADVVWEAHRISEGNFVVLNRGMDTAYEVRVEAWTKTELVEATQQKVPRDEVVEVGLPRRVAGEFDEVDLPPVPKPIERPPGIPVPQEILDDLARIEKQAAKDVEEVLRSQVQVRITWRSKRGNWSTYMTRTG